MVDMAMVGQYQGSDGTAALAVVAPVWNVIYSLGLLMGIGGSVLFSMRRGGGDSRGSENQFFTAAFIGSVILAAVAWADMILFEKPILLFFGADALAVYGPVINVSTFVQCCAYSVGQAAQPILSTNFGARQSGRIRETLRLALGTTAVFGAFWTALSLACPNLYIRIFMDATPEIFAIAPGIIHAYAHSFLLLPFNIFSTYYFQAILQPRVSFVVSVERGLVVSDALILLLPPLFGADALWYAMPVTELVTAVYVAVSMKKYTGRLPE